MPRVDDDETGWLEVPSDLGVDSDGYLNLDWLHEDRAENTGPSVRVQEICARPQILNMHVIDDSIFRVYNHVVYRDDLVIARHDTRILNSAICGKDIVLVLENGDVVLSDLKYSFSMFVREPRKLQIAASQDGRYIAVNSSIDDLVVLKNDGNNLLYFDSFEVWYAIPFRITVYEGQPYLWTFSETDCVELALYLIGDKESFDQMPIAKCPLPGSGSVRNLFACTSPEYNGVVCGVDDQVFFVGHRQIVVGEFEGILRCKAPVQLIMEARKGDDYLVYVTFDGKVAQVNPSKRNHAFDSVVAQLSSLAATFDRKMWQSCSAVLHNGSVQYTDRDYKVRKFALDARKRPWRLITSNNEEVRIVCIGKKIDKQADSGIKHFQSFCYEPVLKAMVVINVKENQYLGADKDFPKLRSEPLVLWGLVKRHSLIYVYPNVVEVFSGSVPFPKLDSVPFKDRILGAALGECCVVHTFDSAFMIDSVAAKQLRLDTGMAPVTFVSVDKERIYVGLDVSLRSQRNHFARFRGTTGIDRFLPENGEADGCIAIFSYEGTLVDLQMHPHPPSGWHKFKDAYEIALYGPQGVAVWVHPKNDREDWAREAIDFEAPLKWGGVAPSNEAVLLRNTSIYVAAGGVCERLAVAEEAGKKNAYYVTDTAFIDDSTVAYVEKQQLKYLYDANLQRGGPHAFTLKATHSAPFNSDMLLVESQRLLILYGAGSTVLLDSFSLQPMTVRGPIPEWEALTLWEFQARGNTFQHLIAYSRSGGLVSYKLTREGMTLTIELKFRLPLTSDPSELGDMPSDMHEHRSLLTVHRDLVLLCQGRKLLVVRPELKTVREVALPDPALHVSASGDYIIVTMAECVIIIGETDQGHIRGIVCVPATSGRMNEEMVFFRHAAQVLDDKSSGTPCLYILVAAQEVISRRRVLLGYIVNGRSYKAIPFPLEVRLKWLDVGVRELVDDPKKHDGFLRTYALMDSGSICAIDVFPPLFNGARPIGIL